MRVITIFLISLLFTANTAAQCLNSPEFPITDTDENKFSWSSSLYGPETFNAGLISSFTFQVGFPSPASFTLEDQKIFIRHSNVNSFTNSSYPGNSDFTQVFEGDVQLLSNANNTITVILDTAFAYNGFDNIEILYENHSDKTHEEIWFKRTIADPNNRNIGKIGFGNTWANAISSNSNFRNFAFSINENCLETALPVNLEYFKYNCFEENLNLEWSVASEKNNSFFTLEHSTDGKNWKEVIKIESKNNNDENQKYIYLISNSYTSGGLYKLSQTDLDGKELVLEIIKVHCSSKMRSNAYNVYPNPFINEIKIETGSNSKIKSIDIFDFLGRKLNINVASKDGIFHINTSSLNKGLYIIKIQNELNESKTYKLNKQ